VVAQMEAWRRRSSGAKALIDSAWGGTAEAAPFVQPHEPLWIPSSLTGIGVCRLVRKES
jgi:hypothetical protein